MRNYKKYAVIAAALCAFGINSTMLSAGAYAADRVDGICDVKNAWQDRNWSTGHSWLGGAYAKEGGRASFSGEDVLKQSSEVTYSSSYFTVNVSSLSLMGIDFGKLSISLNQSSGDQYKVKMVGPYPYLSATSHSISRNGNDVIYWPRLNAFLVGDGKNVLAKEGTGPIYINRAPTDFAGIDVNAGTIVLTNTTVDVSSNTQPLNIKTGKVLVTPPDGETITIANVVAKEGAGRLAITNNATVSMTKFERGTSGILRVETSNGGKVIENERTAGTAIDGGLISVGSDGGVKFLDYDTTNGFVPGDSDSVPANATVFGNASGSQNVEIDSGNINTEYVYCNAASGGTNTLKLTGTLPENPTTIASFKNGGNRVKVSLASLPVTDRSINFAGAVDASITLSGESGKGGKEFPFSASSKVTLFGNQYDTDNSPSLTIYYEYVRTINSNFRLGGCGTGTALMLDGTDWGASYFRSNGSLELLNDASISTDGDVRWYGAISGRGGIIKKGSGALGFYAANDFNGTLKIDNGDVYLKDPGTLGPGDINITAAAAELGFTDNANVQVVTNYFTGSAGTIRVQNSQIELTRPVTLDRLIVQDKVDRVPTVTLGGDTTAKYIINDIDCLIKAGDKDVTLTSGGGTWNSVIRGDLKDGSSGKLSLKKTGSNVLVLAGTNNTFSGGVVVSDGTLKLGPGELSGNFSKDDVSIWLDGSDRSTMTIKEEGGKQGIVQWRSKVGGVSLDNSWGAAKTRPAYVDLGEEANDYFNNNSFVRLTYGNAEWLYTDTAMPIRTVFIVCRQREGTSHAQGSLLNYANQDCSLRINSEGYVGGKRSSGDCWISGRSESDFYHNGKKTGSAYLRDYGSITHVGAHTIAFYNQRKNYGLVGYYSHQPEFALRFGSVGRDWNGDVGEIIAFNRFLAPAELRTVENYLIDKWNPQHITKNSESACHVERRVNYIPSSSAVEISKGAVLDLNGSDQMLQTITGDGVVTNSSSSAAKLTITGSSTFRGTIAGNITFTVPSGAQEVCLRNGATLSLSGTAAATLAPGNVKPPTDSVVVWLDATDSQSIDCTDGENGTKLVTDWRSRSGVEAAAHGMKPRSGAGYVWYDETGWTATGTPKPMVKFLRSGTKYSSMSLRKKGSPNDTYSAKCGTLFMVVKYPGSDYRYSFNFSDGDTGLTVVGNENGYDSLNFGGQPTTIAHAGDTIRINGKEYSPTGAISSRGPHVIAMRMGENHFNGDAKSHATGAWELGSYSGTSRAVDQHVGELIGYSRQLTDAEMLATERYLMSKWIAPEAANTEVFDSTCSLAANGVSVDLGSQALSLAGIGSGTYTSTGGFTIGGITLDVANGKVVPAVFNGDVTFGNGTDAIPLTVNSYSDMSPVVTPQVAVSATGGVTGSITTDAAEHRHWKFDGSAASKLWSFMRPGMLLLLR